MEIVLVLQAPLETPLDALTDVLPAPVLMSVTKRVSRLSEASGALGAPVPAYDTRKRKTTVDGIFLGLIDQP